MAHALDAVISKARSLERAGSVDAAAELVAQLIAASIDEGELRPWLFRWRARLDIARGRPVEALRLLTVVRQRFGGSEAFLAQAEMGIACVRARDLAGAKRFAADLDGGEAELDETPDGVNARLRRARALTVGADERVALLRLYAEIWTATGGYRAAAATVEAARDEASAAPQRFRTARMALDLADLYLSAGELERAAEAEARRPTADAADAPGWARHRLRRAIAAGQLAVARREAEALRAAPRAATQRDRCERTLAIAELEAVLNRFAVADALVAELLSSEPALDPSLRARIERFREVVQLRSTSALEDFEVPFLPEQVFDVEDPFADEPEPDEHILAENARATARVRLAPYAAWAAITTAIMGSLERGEMDNARRLAEKLDASPCQSRYIELRTRFYRALVGDGGASEFTTIAQELEQLGFLPAALQLHRHAGWRAIRSGNVSAHLEHARRAHDLVATITRDLAIEDRVYFMLNQWSAEDEFVSARTLEVTRQREGAPKSKARRALVDLYRGIASLDAWHLDRSLRAEAAGARSTEVATHQIEEIVRHQLELSIPRRAQRFQVRSGWSLWRLPRDTTVLHFRVLADRVLVFELGFRRCELHIIPVVRAVLHEEIRGLLLALQNEDADATRRLGRMSQLLGVAALLRNTRGRRIVVVPHDAIVNVPFAALPIDDSGTRMCERYTVAYVPHVEYLAPRRRKVHGGSLLGVAVSDYGGQRADLPGAREEVATVGAISAKHGWTVTRLEEAEARSSAVVRALSTHRWAHFACHGVFDRDQPHRSGLLVGGLETLTVEQISSLDLSQMHAVVLAACWTAESAALPGLERISLPGALLRAGAGAVVASLWEVDDAGSRELMQAFYERAPTIGCEAALAEIQRDAHRRRRGSERQWANFVVYGTS